MRDGGPDVSPFVLLQVPDLTLAAIDDDRGDTPREDWILGAIGLRLSPLPEVIAEVIPPDMVPPGLAAVIGE